MRRPWREKLMLLAAFAMQLGLCLGPWHEAGHRAEAAALAGLSATDRHHTETWTGPGSRTHCGLCWAIAIAHTQNLPKEGLVSRPHMRVVATRAASGQAIVVPARPAAFRSRAPPLLST